MIRNAESLRGEKSKLKVFEPGEMGGMAIKNRLVRSATNEGWASEDGGITDELVGLYKTLAEGRVGVIITGYTYGQLSGKDTPYMKGIDRDDLIPGLRRERAQVVASFKFPHQIFKPKQILNKEQLVQFYRCLESTKEKALFMLYATTGLRRDEILSLKLEDIDFNKRMITPDSHNGETKKSWVSFYNQEAETVLKEYLATKKQSRSQRLFPMQRDEVVELWKSAREKTGTDITPQKLRQWFSSEMLRLGVSETHVDAFCGRVPKSVLARHYTDFSPQKLEEIYEKANVKILS